MLYNKMLYLDSLKTTKEIVKKINKVLKDNTKIVINTSENFENDAVKISYCDSEIIKETVELKQRQNYFLRKVLDDELKMYDKITIQKSTVDHNSNIYIIYDKSMSCCMIFRNEFIDRENVIERNEKTEIGFRKIKYYTIDKKYVQLLDLKSGKSKFFE